MKTILDLPTEVILLIADYVGPIHTVNLKNSCEFMNRIFTSDHYWKHFAYRYIEERCPPIEPTHSKFPWEQTVVDVYREQKMWEQDHCVIRYSTISHVHLGPVDAVALTENGQLMATGCRDRTIGIWDLRRVMKRNSKTPKIYGNNAHDGWIWKLFERSNVLYSASWDKTVKMWDLRSGLTHMKTFDCDRTVLSMCLTDCQRLAVGLYTGDVLFFNPFSGKSLHRSTIHRKPVLQLASSGDLLFSISQDKKLGFYDLRTSRILAKRIVNANSMPLALSACINYAYVGDSWGDLYLFDVRMLKKFSIYTMVPQGHKRQITDIVHGNGTILISSADGFVRLYTLTDPPKLLLEHNGGGEAITIDFKNHVIAVGKSNNQTDVLSYDTHPFFH